MTKIAETEIRALIQLLDDPNPEIFSTVSEQLIAKGPEVINSLEVAWEEYENDIIQSRIENIIQRIQFAVTYANLSEWVQEENHDLVKGAYYIARYQYPDLTYEEVLSKIEAIRNDIWLEINDNLTALEKVKILNHIIYGIHKFSRSVSNYFSPQNYYIHEVLNTKKGSPVMVGLIYVALAQDLGLPVYGVNLPRNFILAYKDEFAEFFPSGIDDEYGVLFYINPYNKGAVFGKKEIAHFIEQQKLKNKDTYYKPCSNIVIIRRLIKDMMIAYKKQEKNEKVSDLEDFLTLL